MMEWVIAALEESAGGSDASAEEVASQAVRRWHQLLPARGIELARVVGDREAVIALTADGERPAEPPEVECTGPAGLRLRLWARRSEDLSRLAPLLKLALTVLASSPPAATGEQEPETGGDRDREVELPAPGSLSPTLREIYRRAGKIAAGDIPVLILGESGVGKEVLARWIHRRSHRCEGPFLALNCAALPRDLLEAELFGIERGVATGVDPRDGLLQRANGGTVFLDELGDMALETQAKLLRALENHTVYRVGGRRSISFDVRFLATTNQDLENRVEEGRFRRDLYHRLAGWASEPAASCSCRRCSCIRCQRARQAWSPARGSAVARWSAWR